MQLQLASHSTVGELHVEIGKTETAIPLPHHVRGLLESAESIWNGRLDSQAAVTSNDMHCCAAVAIPRKSDDGPL
jgi:hypothetical protein